MFDLWCFPLDIPCENTPFCELVDEQPSDPEDVTRASPLAENPQG